MTNNDDGLDINYDEPAKLPEDGDEAQRRIEWHARMIRHFTTKRDREVGAYKREIERLKERIEEIKSTAQKQIDWHTAPIESFHFMLMRADKDTKTVDLPHGKSKITTPVKPVVDSAANAGDEGVRCFEWLRASHPDSFSLPSITAIRKLVAVQETDDGLVVVDASTGEVLDFLVAAVPDQTYKFTPTEGDPL